MKIVRVVLKILLAVTLPIWGVPVALYLIGSDAYDELVFWWKYR